MSVLAGAIDIEGRADALVDRMLPSLTFVAADHHADRREGHFAAHAKRLVVEDADRGPLLVPSQGGIVVALDGHLFNAEELRLALGHRGDASAETLIAAAWEKWGDAFVGRLNGEFALAAWNGRTRRLLLAADHLASVPLYWTRLSAGRYAFSTELSAVVAARNEQPQPDWCKIADFLAEIGEERDRSFVHNIAAVPPGGFVAIAEDIVDSREYWRYGESAPARFARPDTAIEACSAALDKAIRARLPSASETASHLTGGLDSSAVSALAARSLEAQGRRLQLYSIVPWLPGEGQGPSDAEFIPAFLRDYPACGHRYLIGEPGESRYPLPGLHNGPLNLQLTTAIQPMSKLAREAGCRVTLTGWGGEASITYPGHLAYQAALMRGDWRWLFTELWSPSRSWRARAGWLRNLLFGDVTAPMDRAARALWPMLEQCLQPEFVRRYDLERKCLAPRGSVGDPLLHGLERMLAGILRQGRLGAWRFQARAEGFRYRYPLLDRQLLEAVAALPAAAHVEGGRGREVVRRLLGDALPAEIRLRPSKFSPTVNPALIRNDKETIVPCDPILVYLKDAVRSWPTRSTGERPIRPGGVRVPVGLFAHQLRGIAEFLQTIEAIRGA